MDTNLYNDKYKLLIKKLLTHTQFADNPVKFDGKGLGDTFMHYKEDQCKNILQSLQDDAKVLKIIKYKKLNKTKSPLSNDGYYYLEIYPEFEDYASRVLSDNELTSHSRTPTSHEIKYKAKTNTLYFNGYELNVKPNTIEGLILKRIATNKSNSVNIHVIENDYKEMVGKTDYILKKDILSSKVKALNQKFRRKLHSRLGLISIKGNKVRINPSLLQK